MKKALLALENGFVLEGQSFTGSFETGGELIFNTGMLGYQELLTDPAYYGQIVCMTYPHIGSYGINPEDMQSDRVHLRALLVKECSKVPSNWMSTMSLPDFLSAQGVPGVEGIDTRALMLELRSKGSMRAMLSTEDLDPAHLVEKAKALPSAAGQNYVEKVAPASPWMLFKGASRAVAPDNKGHLPFVGSGIRSLVYDFGVTRAVVNQLTEVGFSPVMVPPSFSIEQAVASGAQAVFLSGGPGDATGLTKEIALVHSLTEHFPVVAMGLGAELLGLALGAKAVKMKVGHHGANYPVKDVETGHVEICVQNHDFCLDVSGAPELKMTYVNLNDESLEGFSHKTLPLCGILFQSAAGPEDNKVLFTGFRNFVASAF